MIEFLVIMGIVVIVALLMIKVGIIGSGIRAYLDEKLRESSASSFAFKAVFMIAVVASIHWRFKRMVRWRDEQREKAARRGVPMVRRSIRVFFWLSLASLVAFFCYVYYRHNHLASTSIGAIGHASLLQQIKASHL